jgi:hypothetical protein
MKIAVVENGPCVVTPPDGPATVVSDGDEFPDEHPVVRAAPDMFRGKPGRPAKKKAAPRVDE